MEDVEEWGFVGEVFLIIKIKIVLDKVEVDYGESVVVGGKF